MTTRTQKQAQLIHETVRLLQRRMARTFYEAFQSSAPCGELTLRQMSTMMVIHERREVSIKELAEELSVSPPSASAMVDRLHEMGLVVREPSHEDRREVRVRLSDRGEAHSQEMEGHFISFISGLIERIGEQHAQQWCAVYKRLHEVLSEGGPSTSHGSGESS